MSTATRITVADYDRMIAEGVFEGGPKRQRIELIDGELRPMSPIGPIHEVIVDALNEWSMTSLPPETVYVRIQNSIGIPELDGAPEPDVVWARRKDYRAGRPQPGDVLLLIEVSDSSLDFDREIKAHSYAGAGIEDYWVINIPDHCVEIFRQPQGGEYRSREVFQANAEVHPLAFPKVELAVAKLFPAG